MAHNAYVVRVPFTRRDPLTGAMRQYRRGDIIAHPVLVGDIHTSEHEHHATRTWLPADHPEIIAARIATTALPSVIVSQ